MIAILVYKLLFLSIFSQFLTFIMYYVSTSVLKIYLNTSLKNEIFVLFICLIQIIRVLLHTINSMCN